MNKRFALVFLALITVHVGAEAPLKLEFDGSHGESRHVRFSEALLSKAYQELGYDVTYRPMPMARGNKEANQGMLDGLRVRKGTLSDELPNLRRVNFPIFDFRVLLIGDRRRCGICDYRDLDSVAMPRGFKAGQQWLRENPRNNLAVVRVVDAEAAINMQRGGRVDAALVADVMLDDSLVRQSAHEIRITLKRHTDYHFLHQRHAELVDSVESVLLQMQINGTLARLRQQYKVEPPRSLSEPPEIDTVTAITASWGDYTQHPDDVYWRLLDHIFASADIKIVPKLSNWRRAKEQFANGQYDILVGAYDHEVPDTAIASEVHLEYEYDVVAAGRSEELLNAVLEGEESVFGCAVIGYGFDEWLPDNINVYYVQDFSRCAVLYEEGKVQVVIDYLYNIGEMDVGVAVVTLREGSPIFVAFQDDVVGHYLKEVFDQQLRALTWKGAVKVSQPNDAVFKPLQFNPKE